MPDVLLPVLNEAHALPWVLERLPDGFNAVVADNGSTDGSGDIARQLGATVVVEPRRGFGAACWAALTASQADIVCFMDADASLDPTELPGLVAPVADGAADMVIGERRPDPGAWQAHARIGNRLLGRQVQRRTGVVLRDIGPMRVCRRLPLLDLAPHDRRSGFPLEVVLLAARAGWRIQTRSVSYRPRVGRSKVTGTVRGTVTAVRDMRKVLR